MEDFIYYNNLYDYYKNLLTEMDRNYFEDYYQNNLTLSEMAINYDVSRNAVHKRLKKIVSLLNDYENKLGLFDKTEKILHLVSDNEDLLNKIERIIG